MHPGSRPIVGLALGGGAARGMAHVGVLRAFKRANIPVHVVTGTSMGAIIGGAYAAGVSEDEIERLVRQILTSEEFRRNRLSFLRETKKQRGSMLYSVKNLVRRGIIFGVSNLRPSFLSAEEFVGSIEKIVPDIRIEDTKKTFAAIALDIDAAEEVVICKGRLRHAASASSAIPGILPPVPWGRRLLIDGGWVDKVPVLPAYKLGADIVIGVDITADLDAKDSYRKGVEVMLRANAIKDDALVAFSRRLAHVMITPQVGGVHWADFGAFPECIESGDRAATEQIPLIREIMAKERFLSRVRPSRRKRLARFHLDAQDKNLIII